MRSSFRLCTVFGIAINIHVTFLLLFIFFFMGGLTWLAIIAAIFFFVTIHELAHALMARRFGVEVREITLLPIGGIASMTHMPKKPSQEFLIAIAGPALNIAIVIFFFYPLKYLIGIENLLHPLSTATVPLIIAYLYWLNLILAVFNLIPAFPMDGGRALRALLAIKLGYQRATRIAVRFGHFFALVFAYFGIVNFNLILIAIAIFIYMTASNEGLQVDLKETLKKFKVRDILSHDFFTITTEATLAKVLELVFHSHQEDFPVMDGQRLAGFITRQDVSTGVHQHGLDRKVSEIMRREFPLVREGDSLIKVHAIMSQSGMRALPVVARSGEIIGVVTLEDIGRVYAMLA